MKIYSTGESSRKVSFNMIWKERGVRVRQQYIDPADGTVVPRDEIVKGYEFAKGQYVLFTEDELKALQAKATQTIEITEFIPTEKIDPIYFEKSYFLGPDKGGDRAYKLLSQALAKSGRSALAKYAARGQAIENWGLHRTTVTAEVAVAEVVDEQGDDIGTLSSSHGRQQHQTRAAAAE